jgi:transposase-like protein
MGRRPRVDRSPEEKWQFVQEGIKSGNVSETCRRHGISPMTTKLGIVLVRRGTEPVGLAR